MRSLALLVALAACALRDPPTVTPAQPLPADPPIKLETMQIECDAMLAALATYKDCVNLEPEDKTEIDAWVETATRSFESGKKANPEPNAQAAIAGACRKATESVKAATERCHNGKAPKRE